MDRHHRALQLPVELLSLVFDLLSLGQLLTSSHVSRFWRDVAVRHPTIWRDIRLAALSTSALDFFHFRLDASTNRGLLVHVCLPKVNSPARLRSVVLPAVAGNIHRCRGLFLEIDIAYDVDVFNALRTPAPSLETLDICMVHDTKTSSALPIDLLADEAHNLRRLQLINVQLYSGALPPVLSSVVDLSYGFLAERQSFPVAVFAHSPALQRLAICGRHCSMSVQDDLLPLPRSTDQLRSLDLAVFTGSLSLMQHVPCSSLPDISISLRDLDSAPILLSHLQGNLELSVHCGAEFTLSYKSLSTNRKRTFVGGLCWMEPGLLPPIYVADELLSRVQSATISSNCANLLPAFEAMPSCKTIDVTLVDGERLQPPPRPILVPELKSVVFSSALGASVSIGELMTFFDAAFASGSRPVDLVLQNITLDGDLQGIDTARFINLV